MKVALTQINPVAGDFEKHAAKISQAAAEAKGRCPRLAVFSELSLCSHPPMDLVECPVFAQGNLEEFGHFSSEAMPVFPSRLVGHSS